MRVQDNMLIVEETHCAEQHTCECCGQYYGESAWTEITYHSLHPVYNATREHIMPSEMFLSDIDFGLYFDVKEPVKVLDYDAREFVGRIPSQMVIREKIDGHWRFVCGFDLPTDTTKGSYWLGLNSGESAYFSSFAEIKKTLNMLLGEWAIFLEEPFTKNA